MEEMLKLYIGRECIIYTETTQYNGVIESAADGWLAVRISGAVNILNMRYITRIREYPKTGIPKKRMKFEE